MLDSVYRVTITRRMPHEYSEFPPVLPDSAPTPKVLAETIALRRLFAAALDVRSEVTLVASLHPGALQALSDWAHENGRGIEVRHYDAIPPQIMKEWSVFSVTLGNGSEIRIYVMSVAK